MTLNFCRNASNQTIILFSKIFEGWNKKIYNFLYRCYRKQIADSKMIKLTIVCKPQKSWYPSGHYWSSCIIIHCNMITSYWSHLALRHPTMLHYEALFLYSIRNGWEYIIKYIESQEGTEEERREEGCRIQVETIIEKTGQVGAGRRDAGIVLSSDLLD